MNETASTIQPTIDNRSTLQMTSVSAITSDGLTRVSRRLLVIASLVCGITGVLSADDLAWHDHRFLQMLSRRNLESLARIHATQQRDQATDPDIKARWQHALAELAREEMWFVDGPDRSEILQHNLKASLAIKEITDPLLRFRLRMETGRMVLAESEAALVTAEAGTLYGKQSPSSQVFTAQRLQQLASEIRRLETSNREITGRSSSLNSQQKTRARDELRILIASLKCQKLHWLVGSESINPAQPLNSLNAELEDMVRATRSETSRTQLRLLLADLAARYLSEADYRLKMTPLLSEDADLRPSALVEVRVRYRLRQREIDLAQKDLALTSTLSRLEKQKRLWLVAEVCVGQVEQAVRLNRTAMISAAGNRLNDLMAALPQSDTGTYADAARHCLQKSERILELGPELAALIEQVDISRQLGENEKALQQVSVALKRLPTSQSHSARPALLLIATKLNIDQQLWADAIITGGSAAIEFQQHSLPQKAAAADLLKCFAMAQVIKERPNGRSDYLAALQAHGRKFPRSPTSAIAVKWMLQLTAAASPESAIRVALDRLKQIEASPERTELRATVNQIFWQLLTSLETSSDQQIKTWHDELHQEASVSDQVNSIPTASIYTTIAVQLVLNQATVPQMSSWQQVLANQSAQKPGMQQNLQYQLLNFVLNAKQSVVAETLQQQRQQILQRPSGDQEQAFSYLARVLEVSRKLNRIQPGDIVLARTIDQLALNLLKSTRQPAVVGLKLMPIVSTTASITGDQDAMQRVMTAVSPDRISPEDLLELVPNLSRLSAQAGSQQTTITPALKTVLIDFWQRLVTSQPAGSDLWLEGLIQVGTLSSDTKDIKELKRQFRMANVLYPEWGGAERRVRATAILKRLQNTP